jgi:hypothetical protein
MGRDPKFVKPALDARPKGFCYFRIVRQSARLSAIAPTDDLSGKPRTKAGLADLGCFPGGKR